MTTEPKFKAGDKVICVDANFRYCDGRSGLAHGEIYTVDSVKGTLIVLSEINGAYFESRFRLKRTAEQVKLDKEKEKEKEKQAERLAEGTHIPTNNFRWYVGRAGNKTLQQFCTTTSGKVFWKPIPIVTFLDENKE